MSTSSEIRHYSPSEVAKLQQAEADWFDACNAARTVEGRIPPTADIRRATRVIGTPGVEPVDREIYRIQQGHIIDTYLNLVAPNPGGRVLDLCCGPGWLSLELGRRGQIVDAFDLSPVAIAVAQRMVDENPYREGFGQVNYTVGDVTRVDLGVEKYDAVSGWSAFHHLPDFHGFMERVHRALKPGGVVATCDDFPRRPLESWLQRAFRLALPTTDRSYRQKIADGVRRLSGRSHEPPERFTPMEEAKFSVVHDIEKEWTTRYELLEDLPFNAFALPPMLVLGGPDWFRYPVARALDAIDKLGCRTGLLHGQSRVMISRKRA